jgi:serine/threonine protein kinase
MSDLKLKLQLLHAFQLVHLDIKPPNIMYSDSREDLVFIDFGLSKAVKESVGFKSLTNFRGSVSYCSPEMLKLFHSKK